MVSERVGAIVSTSLSVGVDFGGLVPHLAVSVFTIEIKGDILNFSNVTPVIHVGDIVA